jgi:methyl-accepting chemotaxis protein
MVNRTPTVNTDGDDQQRFSSEESASSVPLKAYAATADENAAHEKNGSGYTAAMAAAPQRAVTPEVTPDPAQTGRQPSPGKATGRPLLRQLIIRLVPGVLLPVALAGLAGYILTAQRAAQLAEQALGNEATGAGEAINELVGKAQEVPILVAINPYVIKAAKDGSILATSLKLDKLSTYELEQRYADTRLLKVDTSLNNYLKRSIEVTNVSEIFFTEQHGFNVGASGATSDFVQSDESWWKDGKDSQAPLLVESFDESSGTLGFEITQRITDPDTGDFLGVVKAVVPAKFFEGLLGVLKGTIFFKSTEIQVVSPSAKEGLSPLVTLTQGGISKGQEVFGGDTIKQRINALSQLVTSQSTDLKAAAQNADYPVNVMQFRGGSSGLASRLVNQGRVYVLSTVPNTNWVTVTSVEQSEIDAASRGLAALFGSAVVLIGAVSSVLIFQSARQVSNPLAQLAGTANQVAGGNLNVYAEPVGTLEAQTLANSFNNLVSRVKLLLQSQVAETERSQVLRDLTLDATQARTTHEILSQLPLPRLRQVLKCDRLVFLQFEANWEGVVVAESVGREWPRMLGSRFNDPCFEKGYGERYKRGRIQAINNLQEADIAEEYLKALEPFVVKANLIAPINQGEQLLGLLIAHQCNGPRVWERFEIDFLAQAATQVGLALERCDLLRQTEASAEQARQLAEEQRQQKEALQLQLVELLGDVEGAASGDLTVRAEVGAGEIGTVADFFNSIIESLRQIVTQVKQSAVQVNLALGENEGAIRHLADEALRQSEETTRTLDSVEQMTRSIQAVAESARQAALVTRTASETAEAGGAAMDLTVQNILSLRETVGETAKKVKRLGEASQQISKVVSLINQIAMQTNLLAINAGIEAARAGEEGQGFAVVAEEVGELANRSAAATQEIERIVETIQRETNQVVEAMEQSTAQVVEGTHRVEGAKQSLTRILDVSRQIDQLVQSISDATVSQVEISQSVSQVMREIAQVSERTSGSSLQVSKSLQQTVEIAQELRESVGAFKVGVEA